MFRRLFSGHPFYFYNFWKRHMKTHQGNDSPWKIVKRLWCTFEIACMSSCLEPCWIFFRIHKGSPLGYFTVWVYTAFFPDRSLLHIMLGLSIGLVSGFSPCFFCKCMWDASFGILNVQESSKGTWWLICTTGQGCHKNCSWVQQNCNQSPWQKSHYMRLTIMGPWPPAAIFYDSVLHKVFVC